MARGEIAAATGRYTRVAVGLHWLMAAAILFMLGLGFLMGSELVDKPTAFKLFQLHKSVGIVLLWLIAVRIVWRQTHRLPKWPDMSRWEKFLAAKTHLSLYFLMIAMPLSGWLLVSSSPLGMPTMLFGLVEWPHLGFAVGNDTVHQASETAHGWLAWTLLGMIALHSLAVVKHWLIDRQNILVRMSFRREAPPRRTPTIIALAVLLLLTPAAQARPYTIDYSKSKIEFAVAQNGELVKGSFPKWSAAIDFDADHPETSKISATIDLTTATTGDTTRDVTLASADWLDSKTSPQATFVSQQVTGEGFGAFTAVGTLTLRGQAKPATLSFKLPFSIATGKAVDGTVQQSPLDAALEKKETPKEREAREKKRAKDLEEARKKGLDPTVTTVTASLTIKRLDYGIGAKSDATGQWVGLDVPLALTIVASPQ